MVKPLEIGGKRFGRLVAIKPVKFKPRRKWLCICDCGNETYVGTSNLTTGNTKSCGCANPFKFKHGYTGTNLESKYYDMRRRCYSPKADSYKYYGGRGIKVCDEWLNNPSAFYDWAVDNGYSPVLEIDRIDNDGDYSPENCHFVTHKENMANTRRSVNSLKRKSLDAGFNPATVQSRLHRGWSLDEALTIPLRGAV